MSRMRLVPVVLLAFLVFAPADARAQHMVKLKGTWTGVTASADLSTLPLVTIVSEGEGEVSHLGRSTMVSPHTSNVETGETLGDQIFTAANGDTLTADCAGVALPNAEGVVVGTLACEITSGTGRFAGATGFYEFSLVASPRTDGGPGFATEAEIDGWISTVGSSERH
jgi:hypothetical protein